MSRTVSSLDAFHGLCPKRGATLGKGYAVTAQNVDLSSGFIRPMKDHALVSSPGGSILSFCKYDDAWITLPNKSSMVEFWENGVRQLVYLDASGTLKKRLGSTVVNVGQTPPDKPTLSVEGEEGPYLQTALTGANNDLIFTAKSSTGHEITVQYVKREVAETSGSQRRPTTNVLDRNWAENSMLRRFSGRGKTEDLVPMTIEASAFKIVINLAVDGSGNILTTAADIKASIELDEASNSLVTVSFPSGEDGSGVVTEMAETALEADGNLYASVWYVITTLRTVEGVTDESGPSETTDMLEVKGQSVKITAPTFAAGVTKWRIYRGDSLSGEFLQVAELDASQYEYTDDTAVEDLGSAMASWYTSSQGNTIIWDAPPTGLDGISILPYSGMIFAFKGAYLYWCEPGNVDAWPVSEYWQQFPGEIRAVVPYGGAVVVLTEQGPFRLEGSSPESFDPIKPVESFPCLANTAIPTTQGIVYLSDKGLCLFNLSNTAVLTEGFFDEAWFRENIDASTAYLIENDNVIYLFQPGFVLCGDYRQGTSEWTILSLESTAAWTDPEDGYVYFAYGGGLYRLHGGTGLLPWIWKSGDLLADHLAKKIWSAVEVWGSGALSVKVYAYDDTALAEKALDPTTHWGRRLNLPPRRPMPHVVLEISGTGTVDRLETVYEVMSNE